MLLRSEGEHRRASQYAPIKTVGQKNGDVLSKVWTTEVDRTREDTLKDNDSSQRPEFVRPFVEFLRDSLQPTVCKLGARTFFEVDVDERYLASGKLLYRISKEGGEPASLLLESGLAITSPLQTDGFPRSVDT